MDPMTMMLLGSLGQGIFGSLFGGSQANKDRELQEKQLAQQKQLTQGQLGLQSTQMNPLAQQNDRQRAALMQALLGGARNFQVTPPGAGSYMPQLSGGLQIPEGGFSAETLAFSSPEARMAGEQEFRNRVTNATGKASAVPMASYGYSGMDPQEALRRALQGSLSGGRRAPAWSPEST